MNHKISCCMIQDLLPLYVDGLTSEETAREIEEHPESCGSCRESCERMKAGMNAPLNEGKQEKKREINYLKTVRNRNIRNMVCAAGAVILAVLAGIGLKLFVIGFQSESYTITYMDVSEDQIHTGGVFWSSGYVYGRHKLVRQNDGTQKLVVYACLASGWNRNGEFNLILNMEDVDGQVDIGGAVVKRDGTVISKMANDLYEARNPYIGDVSANGRLAGVLRLGEQMGGFKNELQTTKEPYGWILKREDSVLNSAVFEARMRDYGCVLLALIDNLGEITWRYTVETEDGAVQRETTLTAGEASEYLEAPIKSFGENPEMVQEMLDRLALP